jgi:formylglycine-generating enzyme required for sulfatase activity
MKKIMVVLSLLIFSCSTTSNYYSFDNALEPAGSTVAETTAQAKQTATPIPVFVRVEGGTFQMGGGNDDEKPVHTVTITGFYMAKYPVTQKEWIAVMGNNPSYFKGDNLPVECVSWYDAVEYCNRLSEKEKLTPAYTINGTNVTWDRNANGYRLPTEAEWEYAAKGGNGSPGNYAYSGSNNIDEVAWYQENSARSTQEVGAKKPNGLGLYDMSGNVYEWCWDWYGNYPNEAQTDPIGASSGSFRVDRGGSWGDWVQYVRSALRYYSTPSFRSYSLGFRVLRNG